jgi:hypothetical protein
MLYLQHMKAKDAGKQEVEWVNDIVNKAAIKNVNVGLVSP